MVEYLDIFNASYARATATGQLMDRFYERFIGAHAEIAEKFKNTDMVLQKKMLRDSLVEMRDFFTEHRRSPYMTVLARVHKVEGREIPRRLYDVWLDCLVEAVRDIDSEFSADVEYAWRVVMAPGVAFMKNHSPE